MRVAAYAARPSGDAKLTAGFRAWQEQVARHWKDVHFDALNVDAQDPYLSNCMPSRGSGHRHSGKRCISAHPPQ